MNDIFDNLQSDAEKLDATNSEEAPKESVLEVEDVEAVEAEVEAEESEEEGEVEDDKSTTGLDASDKTPWGKPGKVPKGIRERFRKLSERDRAKDARITELENAMRQFIESTSSGKPKDPTLQDFLEAGKSENDFIDYLVNQRIESRLSAENQQRQQAEVLKRQHDEINSRWTNAYKTALNDLPDYDEVVASADIEIPTTTLRYIAESDVGPYVTYSIASNDDLQSRIDSANTADKHAIILEVEKNVRKWLANRTKKVSNSAGVQPQKSVSGAKPKVPGSIKSNKSAKALDPATASIEEWLGIN